MNIDDERFVREFQFEHSRCQSYFDLMYKTLQFTFVAIIAIVGIGFGALSEETHYSITFSYVLPICIYVFGILYAYNAYALAICGKRAELLHSKIYSDVDMIGKFSEELKKYIITDRTISMIAYGVPLGFYLVIPAASIIFSVVMYKREQLFFFFQILPFVLLCVYFIIMIIIVFKIINPNFEINKIQKTYRKYTDNR